VLGEMIFFNEEQGRGFIRTEEGERLYVDRAGFLPGEAPRGRCAGLKVDFARAAAAGEHEFAAVEVTLVPEFVGGRARRRRQS
jgi:cold shock CspA family protein